MNKKFPAFPTVWSRQQNADKPKIVFKEHLPNCVGFVSVCGRTVMYGQEYKQLQDEGLIE